MGYRRLFIMRKDLNMSAGKLAAQVAHCAEAYWTKLLIEHLSNVSIFSQHIDDNFNITRENEKAIINQMLIDKDIVDEYLKGEFTKTVCEARNKTHLLKAKAMAEILGLKEGEDFGLIYDACHTELTPEEEDGTTLTGIWFKPLPDELAHKISKKYQLYRG